MSDAGHGQEKAIARGLSERAQRAQDWLFEASFPLWSTAGVAPGKGFWEALSLDGTPIENPVARVRVQARQVIVFSVASLMGWQPARAKECISLGISSLLNHCRRSDGLYGFETMLGDRLTNEKASLYDSAFALSAFAMAVRAGVDEPAREAGGSLCRALDTVMRRNGRDGGYFETLPADGPRLQNPHMHLFEASLAWGEATADQASFERARDILFFIRTNFVDGDGALHEYPVGTQGNRFEAGHQYEWVWLIHEYNRLTGTDEKQLATGFYTKALALTEANGRIALSHQLNGAVRDPVYRTWALTEALKAHLCRYVDGDLKAGARALSTFDRLWADHIAEAHRGSWIDKLNEAGDGAALDAPASTGYHVVLAFWELQRTAAAIANDGSSSSVSTRE